MAATGQPDNGHHHDEVLRLPSATQAVAEAGKAVADMTSEGTDSFIQAKAEKDTLKISPPEMLMYEDYLSKELHTALMDIQDKLAKKKDKKTDEDILLQLKAMSNRLDLHGGHDEINEIDRGESAAMEACFDANESTHTTMVESDIEPTYGPSATNSVTRLGTYSIQDDEMAKEMSDFWDSMSSVPAIQEHTPVVGSDTSLSIQPAVPGTATDAIHCSVQDDLGHDKMVKETEEDKKMACEAKKFADYRRSWDALWSKTCGSFNHRTALSSMHFTYYTPGRNPPNSCASTPETLQILSIKLAKITGGLEWPLSVYGVVAVRDIVDHNRNFLFYRARDDSQELTQNDPFLRLIGPSRSVVFEDMVNIEIELKVKGTTRSQDKAMIAEGRKCRHIFGHAASTVRFENCFCKIELCVQLVRRTTQATILGVQVPNIEKWPFHYGARVACSSIPGKLYAIEDNQVTLGTDPASRELVMVDSKDGTKLKGGDGYLYLSRNVLSVEVQGRLDVDIQSYSKSGDIAVQGLVSFPPKYSKITRKKCSLGGVMVVITVAWSRVATDKHYVLSEAAYV